MFKLLLKLFILLVVPSTVYADCVILLHGLARTQASMNKLEERLTKEGYAVQNIGYPSAYDVIEVHAEQVIPPALDKCSEHKQIHFVTHSMGGILVRQYLSQHQVDRLGRVVMLGPPNKGSEVVDKLGNFPGFYFINGDAGLQLGTGEMSVPNRLGNVDFDLGVIAGTRTVNFILSSLIPGADDGKVSVENTMVEGMNDHLSLPVTHTFMMNNSGVIDQVVHYLRDGRFFRRK